MRMPRVTHAHPAVIALIATLAAGCGGKKSSPDADTAATSDSVAADPTPPAPAPAPSAAQPADAPLTVADIARWRQGMDAEMKAVQDATQKIKTAKNGDDTLSAMMAMTETSTTPVGASAAGVDENRYKVIRSTFSELVAQLTPPALEGMDTTQMPPSLRAEFAKGREQTLARLAPSLAPGVVDSLRPHAVEMRKQVMALVGARLKGAGQ
jgi:hypothetical protein